MRKKDADKDWVDSTLANLDDLQEWEKTLTLNHRDPREFLAGVNVTEVDIEIDTLPGELLELFEKK